MTDKSGNVSPPKLVVDVLVLPGEHEYYACIVHSNGRSGDDEPLPKSGFGVNCDVDLGS